VFQTLQWHNNGEHFLTYPHISYRNMHTVHTDICILYI
jgi:hypothetical protein